MEIEWGARSQPQTAKFSSSCRDGEEASGAREAETQGVHIGRAVFCNQAKAEGPVSSCKVVPKWPLPATTFCDSPSPTCMFGLDHCVVFAPIRNPVVNDDLQKPLGRRTRVFMPFTGYTAKTSEN